MLKFTCSNSTIEVLEEGVKYVQSQQEMPQSNNINVVLEPQLLTLTCFILCPINSIVNFEHVIVKIAKKIFIAVIK